MLRIVCLKLSIFGVKRVSDESFCTRTLVHKIMPVDKMWPLHAFKLILWLVAQSMTIGVERGCMSARREPNERSRSARLGRGIGRGEKTRSKKKSLRPELNWGPTG